MTGQVSVTRQVSFCGTWLAIAMRAQSRAAPRCAGKSDAVCPSGPMPSATRSKLGISAPSSRKPLRIADSYRAAASSGSSSPSMRKICVGAQRHFVQQRLLGHAVVAVLVVRAARSAHPPSRDQLAPTASARDRARGSASSSKVRLRRVAAGDCDARTFPRAATASAPHCEHLCRQRAPAARLGQDVIRNRGCHRHSIIISSCTGIGFTLVTSLLPLAAIPANSSSAAFGPQVPAG